MAVQFPAESDKHISHCYVSKEEQCCTLIFVITQHTHAKQAVRNAGFHALSALTKHLVTKKKKKNQSKLMKVMISYNPFQAKQIPLEEYNRLTVELNQLRF